MKLSLLTLPLLVLFVLALAQAPLIRHVDPSLVPESGPDALALAKLYLLYSSHLSNFNFSSASNLLANASIAYVPERLKLAYQRMNELFKQFTNSINESKTLLDLAEVLYMKGDYNASFVMLKNASVSLSVAEARYFDVEVAVNVLRSLGLSGNTLNQVLSNLNSSLTVLKTRYSELINKLKEAINTSIKAYLTIEVSRDEVFYGEYLSVSGRLTSEYGRGIPNRVVYVHFGPETHTVNTNEDGYFKIWIPVRIYQNLVKTYAEFLSDGIHRYARSSEVYVKVIFFKPELAAWLHNSTCLPGRSFLLYVRAEKGLEVNVRGPFGFNVSFTSNGLTHNFSIPIPTSAKEGVYVINVTTSPVGMIAPGFISLKVNVIKLTPHVEVSVPKYLLTGLTYIISVSSNVESRLEVYSTSAVPTLVNGYNVYLSVPHTYIGRNIDIFLRIFPQDPGYKVVDIKLEIPVYNIPILISVGVILLSIIPAVFAKPYSRQARYTVKKVQPTEAEVMREEGLRSLFHSLVELLKKVTGVEFKPSYTIREYLSIVKGRVPEILWVSIKSFMMELEIVLYSWLEKEKSLIEKVIKTFIKALGGES